MIHHLRSRGIKDPDVWHRQKGLHNLTEDTLSWKWLDPQDDIQGRCLDFVDLASNDLRDYIIVLKNHKRKDTPVPLGTSLC